VTQRVAIVIGGGPAGAASAAVLCARGWKTTVIERSEGAHAKCCGECLVARAAPMLRVLGLGAALDEAVCARTRQVRVHDVRRAGGAAQTLRMVQEFGAHGCGFVVPRARFDAAMLAGAARLGASVERGAGARVLLAPGARPVVERRNGVRSEADLVIGADGAGSAVARAAGLAPLRPGRKFGFACTWDAAPAAALAEIPGESIEMLVAVGGYLGLVRRGCAVHAAALVDSRTPLAGPPARVLEFFAARHAGVSALVASGAPAMEGGAGPLPWRPRGVATDGVALVGDAAGYAEPFTGEGMGWAVESALHLGQALDAFGGAWDARTAVRYEALYRTRIRSKQARCLAIAGVLQRPRIFGAACAAARVLPAVPGWFVRQVVGS